MNNKIVTTFAIGALALFATTASLNAGSEKQKTGQIGDHLYFTGQSVELDTRLEGKHRFVSGYIAENGPLNIIVDTGAGVNVIDSAIARAMGFEKVGEKTVLSGGVEPVTADVVIVPLMRVDNLTIRNAEFITVDLTGMSLGQLQAVLGMELFHDGILTFDPLNERITFSEGGLSAEDPGVVAYVNASRSGFEIEIDVAGKNVSMKLDTGAPSGFTFPLELSKSLPLEGELRKGPMAHLVESERSTWLGKLDGEIRFGEMNYKNPEVTFMDPSAPFGNIGNAVLRDVVLSIDQRNGLLALRKSDAVKTTKAVVARVSQKRRRLGIQFRGMPDSGHFTMARVEAGSLGERAGVEAGDILVALNGRPIKEYDMKALGALFGSAKPLRFEVERNGERRLIEIP